MENRKKVIIAGGGFAGIQLARHLDPRRFEVLLLDRLNHHQFQPLFYQVATSQLEPSGISFPLRYIFRRYKNVRIRMTSVGSVNPGAGQLHTAIGDFDYDYLVLATGCSTNFFGNEEIARHAFTLKSTTDAIALRNHMLQTFERIISAGPAERKALMNVVIVGAGPTGVELAGAFAEIKKHILPKDYPDIDFTQFQILLVEGSPYTLQVMSEASRRESKKYLDRMGVKIYTNTLVEKYDGHIARLSNGEEVSTATLIWAAGVTGNLVGGLPPEAQAPGRRLKVDRTCLVQGTRNVYAVGDLAYMETPKYPKGHPQVANVAIHQARLLASNLKRREQGLAGLPFEYKDLGSMATIGRNKAVVDLPYLHLKGYPAWFIWMSLHLMLILSVKNKLIIFIQWTWAYITKNTSLRLILKRKEDI